MIIENNIKGGRCAMLDTLTYAVRVETTPDQSKTLSDTCSAYLDCCNMVSETAYKHGTLNRLGYQSIVESQSDKL